jgi:hypothetical protein
VRAIDVPCWPDDMLLVAGEVRGWSVAESELAEGGRQCTGPPTRALPRRVIRPPQGCAVQGRECPSGKDSAPAVAHGAHAPTVLATPTCARWAAQAARRAEQQTPACREEECVKLHNKAIVTMRSERGLLLGCCCCFCCGHRRWHCGCCTAAASGGT